MNVLRNEGQKGITLIALVVTIIVLLILAGISITMLMGQNGILSRAVDAKEKTGITQEEELVNLAVSDALSKGLGELTTENIDEALKNNGLNGDLSGDGPWIYIGEYKEYEIEKNGKTTSTIIDKAYTSKVIRVMGNYGVTGGNKIIELNEEENDSENTSWKKINRGKEVKEINKVKKKFAVGGRYYVIDDKGDLYAWGKDSCGELGIENNNDPEVIKKVNGISNVEDIYSDGSSVYAKTVNGEIYSWGWNYDGRLGTGSTGNQTTPVKLEGLSNIEKIYNNGSAIFAKSKTGEIYAWGSNSEGRTGTGSEESYIASPKKVEGLNNVDEIYASYYYSAAKTTNGDLYVWGYNAYGQLGIGNTVDQKSPVKIEGISNVEKVYIGNGSTIVQNKLGELYSCGSNWNGVLGLGTTEAQTSFTKINGISNITNVYISSNYVLAKANSGDLYAWGSNDSGQLGIGNNTDQTKPTKINIKVEDVYIVDYDSESIIVKNTEGELYAWGKNDYGQLGIGNYEDQNTPVKMNGNIKELYNIYSMSLLGKTSNNELYAWGDNSDRMLGIDSYEDQNAPVRVPKFSDCKVDAIEIEGSSGSVKKIIITDQNDIYVNTSYYPI